MTTFTISMPNLLEEVTIILVEIDSENNMCEVKYFSKKLNLPGGGFDIVNSDQYGISDPIDLIVVPCK